MSRRVRVRFAPSPTGPLHLGGVRTALYNYLLAKKTGGDFILRIEDTDQNRYVPGAEDYIVESMEWAGLVPDEGPKWGGPHAPYRQSERKHLYKQYADQLLENGHAYIAFDTPEELEELRERLKAQGVPNPQYDAITRQYMKNSLSLPAEDVERRLAAGEPFVVRIKVPRNEEIRIHDEVRGWVVFHSSQVDDKVIFKADGMPTYHLANVVDDHLMEISHVIRGEEWLPSTPIHVLLYRFLGWEDTMPQFAHLPLILKPDGNGKLSKRDGDRLGFPVFPLNWTSPDTGEQSQGYRERGFLPESFVNFLALLGWNPGTPQELFSMEELIAAFTVERIGKSGARFDFEKAKWFNQQYIKQQPNADLLDQLRPVMHARGMERSDEYMLTFIELFKERVTFVTEFLEAGYFMFEVPRGYDEKLVQKKWNDRAKEIFRELSSELGSLPVFDAPSVEAVVKGIMEKYSLGMGDVLPLLRMMLSGEKGGPPLFDMIALLGRDETIVRMHYAFEHFPALL